MSKTNNNLVAQFYLAYHENSVERLKLIISQEYAGEMNGNKNARQDVIDFAAMFIDAFPDVKFTILDTCTQGTKIVNRWICTGSHWGTFRDLPPTKNQVTINGITIFEVSKNHIEGIWTSWDLAGLNKQLAS